MKLRLIAQFYLLGSLSPFVAAQGPYPAHPHEYVVSYLEHLKTHEINSRFAGFDDCITRLQSLKQALPAPETAYKTLIDGGIAALEKMRDAQDDSKLADLSALGVKFAQHYRSKLAELIAAPQSALAQAYNAFLGLEFGNNRGEPPPRFFEHLLGEILYTYAHYYRTTGYSEPIPEYAKAAMIDSLEWLTPSDDLRPELNHKLPFYFGTLWDRVLPKLEAMDAAQRRTVLEELEDILQNDPGEWDTAIETAARANLATAKARFP